MKVETNNMNFLNLKHAKQLLQFINIFL